MFTKIAIVGLTGASILCALEPLSMLGATSQDWLPGERTFVLVSAGALFASVGLLWAKVRWSLVITVSALIIFGLYQARWIFGTIQSANYDGFAILVFLLFMLSCPFAAAVVVALWGRDFCIGTIAQPNAAPNGGPAGSVDNPNAPGGPPSVS
jgi:hypothetical protein